MKHKVTETSDKNDDVKKRKTPPRNSKMQVVLRELSFLLIVMLTVYATIVKSNARTKKSPPSTPFLGSGSINDFYKGELTQLMHDVSGSTYSFVFFYAPWDADSQDLKYEFLETAEFYVDKVYFAGVNCWEPGSECRARFKDVVERYPQLVAYVGLERAVEYRGPHKADHMIKFLHSIIHPLSRLNSVNDLLRIRYMHDAALIGYLNIHSTSDHGLGLLHETSLSLASRDHVRQIAIGVFTNNKYNSDMNVTATPTIHLYVWNKKFVYEGPLKRASLLKWVMETSSGLLMSINGMLLLKTPIVVMFSPIRPLELTSPNYIMLQRLAMTLMHNATSRPVKGKFSYVEHNTALQQVYYRELAERDSEVRQLCSRRRISAGICMAPPRWHNLTCGTQPKSRWFSLVEDGEKIRNDWREEACRLAERTSPLPAAIPSPAQPLYVNSTFTFACLDSARFEHLAQALGIEISSEPASTAVLIIGDEEMVKIGRGELREERLWLGLSDWSQGKIKRAITGRRERPSPKPFLTAGGSSGRVQLPELGLRGFNQLLHQSKRHSLILYYSQYCGTCSRSSLTLLEISHLLVDAKCLFVSRIDGDRIDLPWHYNLHFFPSLLFLPAVRKSESRLFPSDLMWSFGSISHFLLANLGIEERPEIMLALCAKWGQYPEKSQEVHDCVRETRKLLLDGIDKKLRESRRYPNNRKNTLHSLAFLKAIHLALARVFSIQESLVAVRALSRRYNLGCTLS